MIHNLVLVAFNWYVFAHLNFHSSQFRCQCPLVKETKNSPIVEQIWVYNSLQWEKPHAMKNYRVCLRKRVLIGFGFVLGDLEEDSGR